MRTSIFRVSLWVLVALVVVWVPAGASDSLEILARADSLFAAGDHDSAMALLRAAIRDLEQEHAPQDPSAIELWRRLGYYHEQLGRWAEADEALERARGLADSVYDAYDPVVAAILDELASVKLRLGMLEEAGQLYRRSLSLREQNLPADDPDIAASAFGLARALLFLGDNAQAEVYALRSLALWAGADSPQVIQAHFLLANVYMQLGRIEECEAQYRRALAISERIHGPEHTETASALMGIANVYWGDGKYADAEVLYRRVLRIYEKSLPRHDSRLSAAWINLGLVCETEAKYAEAEAAYRSALSLLADAGGSNKIAIARVLEGLASSRAGRGDFAAADSLLKRSLGLLEDVYGPDHARLALTLHSLAYNCVSLGELDRAEDYQKRALEIVETHLGPGHPEMGDHLQGLAVIRTHQARYTEAESLFTEALAVHRAYAGERHPAIATCLEELSDCYRLHGRLDRSLEAADRAVRMRHRDLQDFALVVSEYDALAYGCFCRQSLNRYFSCYFAADRSESMPSALDIVLSNKGEVSDRIFERRRGWSTEHDSATQTRVEALRAATYELAQLYVSGADEEKPGLYRGRLDSLSRVVYGLEQDLARHSASFRAQQAYREINTQEIASALPANSALVEFVRFDDVSPGGGRAVPHYLVAVLSPSTAPRFLDLGPASAVDGLVGRYKQHMLRVARSGKAPTIVEQQEYRELGRELYVALWRPIESCTGGEDVVFVAPDGALNMISFAGLVDGSNRYLVERTAIHYLSSGRDLIRLQNRVPSGTGLFALGDPAYGEAPAGDTVAESAEASHLRGILTNCSDLRAIRPEPLPASRQEIAAVAQQWSATVDEPVTTRLGEDASERSFKTEAAGHRVIHLAAHGYFLMGACQPELSREGLGRDPVLTGENPLLLSGLVLAGAHPGASEANEDPAEDNILTAFEVAAMDLAGTELAVLSACETGLGEVKDGEGVYGLRRAFQMAGARTVISALWQVPDRATARFMGRLYDRHGRSLAETVRRAQLDLIETLRAAGGIDHPYSWGAFVVMGDWR